MTRRNLLRCAGVCVIGLVLFARPEPVHVRQSAAFGKLFADYRGTNADRAVREFATWSADRVIREAVLPADQSDPWSVAALALFHLEANFAGRLNLPASGPEWQFASHLRGADQLIDDAVREAVRRQDRELLQFYQSWQLARESTIREGAWTGWAEDPISLRLTNDAQVQTYIGASAASRMGPRLDGFNSRIGQPFGLFHGSDKDRERLITARGEDYHEYAVREAERAFRKALELDPSLIEARVRLGRVLDRTNRSKDGIAELERAAAAALKSSDRFNGYLASLFLGQAHEDAGDLPAAIKSYEGAVTQYPSGPAARLALGQLLIRTGREAEGHAMTRSVFGPEAQPALADPWSAYPSPGYWQGRARLATLRARVSKTPFTGLVRIGSDQGLESMASPAIAATLAPRTAPSNQIRFDVLVTSFGTPVPNLTANDFLLIDNVVAQKIDAVRPAGVLSVALVLDTSSSIAGDVSWKKLQDAVEQLRQALKPGDVISVVTASDILTLRADQLKNADVLPALVSRLRAEPEGLSAIWDGVFAAGGLVAEGQGRPVVVVVSDGFDNSSWFRRRFAMARLPKLGIVVDGISVPHESHGSTWRDIAYGDITLREPTSATGGLAFDSSDPALRKKLADQFATLRQSYVLTYTPQNTIARPDGWHNVKITLRSGVEGKVQVRQGYWK